MRCNAALSMVCGGVDPQAACTQIFKEETAIQTAKIRKEVVSLTCKTVQIQPSYPQAPLLKEHVAERVGSCATVVCSWHTTLDLKLTGLP